MQKYLCECMHTCMFAYAAYASLCMCMIVYAYMYAYVCMHLYVCICVYAYVCRMRINHKMFVMFVEKRQTAHTSIDIKLQCSDNCIDIVICMASPQHTSTWMTSIT